MPRTGELGRSGTMAGGVASSGTTVGGSSLVLIRTERLDLEKPCASYRGGWAAYSTSMCALTLIRNRCPFAKTTSLTRGEEASRTGAQRRRYRIIWLDDGRTTGVDFGSADASSSPSGCSCEERRWSESLAAPVGKRTSSGSKSSISASAGGDWRLELGSRFPAKLG